MSKGEIIVGRKKDTEFDFYETPKWATEKILTKLLKDGILNKDDKIYEPCVGAVSKPLDNATCSSPVSGSWNTVMLNSPNAVGNREVATNLISTV